MSKKYTVIASYSAEYYWRGFDNKLFQAAGSSSDGSGMGFGERDHSWSGLTKNVAEKIVKKLKKLQTKKNSLKVEIRSEAEVHFE